MEQKIELMPVCKWCIHKNVCPNDTSIIQVKSDEDGSIETTCPDMIDEYDEKEAKEKGEGNTLIELEGCDDSTIFAVQLTDFQIAFLKKIAKKANEASEYGCMPRMYVKPLIKEKQNDSN